eukprot:COSAG02_NODE_49157_length_328_cov_1.358079_1_plen_70_part_01
MAVPNQKPSQLVGVDGKPANWSLVTATGQSNGHGHGIQQLRTALESSNSRIQCYKAKSKHVHRVRYERCF